MQQFFLYASSTLAAPARAMLHVVAPLYRAARGFTQAGLLFVSSWRRRALQAVVPAMVVNAIERPTTWLGYMVEMFTGNTTFRVLETLFAASLLLIGESPAAALPMMQMLPLAFAITAGAIGEALDRKPQLRRYVGPWATILLEPAVRMAGTLLYSWHSNTLYSSYAWAEMGAGVMNLLTATAKRTDGRLQAQEREYQRAPQGVRRQLRQPALPMLMGTAANDADPRMGLGGMAPAMQTPLHGNMPQPALPMGPAANDDHPRIGGDMGFIAPGSREPSYPPAEDRHDAHGHGGPDYGYDDWDDAPYHSRENSPVDDVHDEQAVVMHAGHTPSPRRRYISLEQLKPNGTYSPGRGAHKDPEPSDRLLRSHAAQIAAQGQGAGQNQQAA